jgi:hypothetical protein
MASKQRFSPESARSNINPICHPSGSLLTLDITPGFILLDIAEAVHIGKAAKVAGVSVDTIRFYQTIGLIKSAGRSAGG